MSSALNWRTARNFPPIVVGWRVSVGGGSSRLFEASLSNDATAPFDISPDGQRFLVRTTSAEGANMMLTLDTNWTHRLKPNPR